MNKIFYMQSIVTWLLPCLISLFSPTFISGESLYQSEATLLTDALSEVGEQYNVFFAYDADLLRSSQVTTKANEYSSLEEAVTSLLAGSGLKFDLVGPKYCVIYKDTPGSRRTKRKLERRIRQIGELEKKGDVSLQRVTTGDNQLLLPAIRRGYTSVTSADEPKKSKRQPAQLKGVVTDAGTGETLIGANVRIVGTSFGAATDLDGSYAISGVPEGSYTIIFSYIGFKNLERAGVSLTGGETLKLNAEISAESVLGEEIIVTAQARGQMAAINQQRASSSITNIVSSDRIKEVPDVNAAESIGRLPGVSLKRSGGEGNKVVVRGLSPQYTNVTIDGVRMTGVDGDRSVGLSIISSEMLDGIELSKSLTADQDADAIGGVVNLRLREAENGLQLRTLLLGGYNDLDRSFSNYKVAANVSNRFFQSKLGVLLNLGQEQVIRSSDRFGASYAKVISTDQEQLFTTSASITERKAVRQRSHGSLMLDYKIGFMKIRFNNFYSRMENDNTVRNNVFRFNENDFRFSISDDQPIESIRTHSLRTIFDVGTTELSVNLAISDTRLDTKSDGYNFEDDRALSGGNIPENDKLFAQPSRLIDQYFDITSGEQSLLLDNVRRTSVRQDETNTADLNWKIPFSLFDNVSGHIKTGAKYASKTRSNDTESRQAYYFGGIGIGRVNTIVQQPEFSNFLTREDVGITNAEGLVGANFLDPDYDYGEILNGRYELGYSMDLQKLKETHDVLYDRFEQSFLWTQGVPSNINDYTNTEDLAAGYIMAEVNIGENLLLLPGVRFENVQTEYTGTYLVEDDFDPDGVKFTEKVTANRRNSNWFPSINARYDVNEWSDIRAAVYRSASRPDYQFLSPALGSNGLGTNINSFNPFLQPAMATNYDVGISFFTNKLGLFTINGFHKEIDNLIYRLPVYQPQFLGRLEGAPASLVSSLEAPRALYDPMIFTRAGTSNNNIPINNPNRAYFTGFEISWQTNFWYLPGLLSGLVLDLNYSRIWSRTEFPFLRIENRIDADRPFPIPIEVPIYDTREARLIDQPADLFNARIGWDFKGFSSRLSFRYQGETIGSLDPVNSLLDEVSSDQFRMDFNMKQKITRRLSFTADVANINEFIDDSNFISRDNIMPRASEFFGLTAQFGFRYNFDSTDTDDE